MTRSGASAESLKSEQAPVIIIGAGISGCSTATRLISSGLKPLVLDEAEFPRDTVGEGLSPAIGPLLEELGIREAIDGGPFTKKSSIQIVSPGGAKAYSAIDMTREPFARGRHSFPWGYNVHRLKFDMVFLQRARSLGADVRLSTRVERVVFDDDGVATGVIAKTAEGEQRLIEAPLILDCSGRASVLARQLDLRGPLEHVFEGQWANFAIRCHFTDINWEPLEAGVEHYDRATVNILPYDDSWYWFIPLDLEDELISVGFVARSKLRRRFVGPDRLARYRNLIESHPVLRKVLHGAKMHPGVVATARLGHMNTRMSGAGFLCVGDAAFFADPAWGTGVTISLLTSKLASHVAVEALATGDVSAEALSRYDAAYRNLIERPFNSIRAYNYYYNDSEYVDFVVERLAARPAEMDMIAAVLFDYASHDEFKKWTFSVFKEFTAAHGRIPTLDRVSQVDFDREELLAKA